MESYIKSRDGNECYKMLLDEANELHGLVDQLGSSETSRLVRYFIDKCDDLHLEHKFDYPINDQLLKKNLELVSKLLATSDFNDFMYQNSINDLISQNGTDNWQVITDIAISVARPSCTKSSMLDNQKYDDGRVQKSSIILKQVSDLFRANGQQPIPYYKLIIDPDNFKNTVENAFQMAILARSYSFGLIKGQDGYPLVRLASKDEIDMRQDFSQLICTLNMNMCQNMISQYEIRKPMINIPADIEDREDVKLNDDVDENSD